MRVKMTHPVSEGETIHYAGMVYDVPDETGRMWIAEHKAIDATAIVTISGDAVTQTKRKVKRAYRKNSS